MVAAEKPRRVTRPKMTAGKNSAKGKLGKVCPCPRSLSIGAGGKGGIDESESTGQKQLATAIYGTVQFRLPIPLIPFNSRPSHCSGNPGAGSETPPNDAGDCSRMLAHNTGT